MIKEVFEREILLDICDYTKHTTRNSSKISTCRQGLSLRCISILNFNARSQSNTMKNKSPAEK